MCHTSLGLDLQYFPERVSRSRLCTSGYDNLISNLAHRQADTSFCYGNTVGLCHGSGPSENVRDIGYRGQDFNGFTQSFPADAGLITRLEHYFFFLKICQFYIVIKHSPFFFFYFLLSSSSQTLRSIVHLGFQNILPHTPTVSVHYLRVFYSHYI